jgi:hypothetical protein
MKRLSVLPMMLVCTATAACTMLPLEDGATTPAAEVSHICSGVPDELREAGPFSSDLVERVAPLRVSALSSKLPMTSLVGVKIYIRAAPGLTAPWIHRVAECHLARHSLPMPEAERDHCPLSAEEAQISVESHGGSFVVSIRTSDTEVAEDILARANALLVLARSEPTMTTALR